jgi:pyruvate kinase
VITATQMLQSMVDSPIPTRAEVLDVANAVIDGTDAVMLSQESAAGKYPLKAVEAMARICTGAEKQFEANTNFELAHATCNTPTRRSRCRRCSCPSTSACAPSWR